MKRPYTITLDGCDDSTHINVWLSDAEHEFVLFLESQVKEVAEYVCNPRLLVTPGHREEDPE